MGVTARGFLVGPGEQGQAALGRVLAERDVLARLGDTIGRLGGVGRATVVGQVAATVAALLDVDLGDLLVAGWRGHQALRAAAGATVAHPGSTEVVELTAHRVSSTHQPYVDVVVAGRSVASLHFELTVAFEVHGLLATVQRGNLVGFQCGRCGLRAALACEGVELVRREGELDARVAIPLRTELPLLDDDDRAAAPPAAPAIGRARPPA